DEFYLEVSSGRAERVDRRAQLRHRCGANLRAACEAKEDESRLAVEIAPAHFGAIGAYESDVIDLARERRIGILVRRIAEPGDDVERHQQSEDADQNSEKDYRPFFPPKLLTRFSVHESVLRATVAAARRIRCARRPRARSEASRARAVLLQTAHQCRRT